MFISRITLSFLLMLCPILAACSYEASPEDESPAPAQATQNDPTEPQSFKTIVQNAEANAENGKSSDALADYGHHWFYGGGMGRTIANVGTVVLFPPYALYLLGNAGLALAGYQPLYITSALPEPVRDYTLKAYNGVTSVPGRVAAKVAGEEFSE